MARSVRIGARDFHCEKDGATAALLTAASWMLGQLPNRVVQHRRGELVRALARAQGLVVEVAVGPTPAVRIKDAGRVLVEIPAKR